MIYKRNNINKFKNYQNKVKLINLMVLINSSIILNPTLFFKIIEFLNINRFQDSFIPVRCECFTNEKSELLTKL